MKQVVVKMTQRQPTGYRSHWPDCRRRASCRSCSGTRIRRTKEALLFSGRFPAPGSQGSGTLRLRPMAAQCRRGSREQRAEVQIPLRRSGELWYEALSALPAELTRQWTRFRGSWASRWSLRVSPWRQAWGDWPSARCPRWPSTSGWPSLSRSYWLKEKSQLLITLLSIAHLLRPHGFGYVKFVQDVPPQYETHLYQIDW